MLEKREPQGEIADADEKRNYVPFQNFPKLKTSKGG
jgi:hypothetical protein